MDHNLSLDVIDGRGCDLVQVLVAYFCGVSVDDLRAVTRRGPRAAAARQITMYLLHVVYRLTMAEVAREFGRDRSTAAHACHRVEDMRDDPRFDRQLAHIENLLREASHIERAA